MVQFEIPKSACHSEARYYRARNLLFRCWQQTDSSPIKLARNDKGRSRGKLHYYRDFAFFLEKFPSCTFVPFVVIGFFELTPGHTLYKLAKL